MSKVEYRVLGSGSLTAESVDEIQQSLDTSGLRSDTPNIEAHYFGWTEGISGTGWSVSLSWGLVNNDVTVYGPERATVSEIAADLRDLVETRCPQEGREASESQVVHEETTPILEDVVDAPVWRSHGWPDTQHRATIPLLGRMSWDRLEWIERELCRLVSGHGAEPSVSIRVEGATMEARRDSVAHAQEAVGEESLRHFTFRLLIQQPDVGEISVSKFVGARVYVEAPTQILTRALELEVRETLARYRHLVFRHIVTNVWVVTFLGGLLVALFIFLLTGQL